MVTHLRRFVTSPLPLFEFEFASESRAPPPLAAAAKCLALCIKVGSSWLKCFVANQFLRSLHPETISYYRTCILFSIISLPQVKRFKTALLCRRTTLSITTRISLQVCLTQVCADYQRMKGDSSALLPFPLLHDLRLSSNRKRYFHFLGERDVTDPPFKVTRLTISMLLQRLRSAEPTVEAAIAYNLVDLALSAPEGSFNDIIRLFSSINRSANRDDPRFSNNMVCTSKCLQKQIILTLFTLNLGASSSNETRARTPSET